jgi:hypothetical protein
VLKPDLAGFFALGMPPGVLEPGRFTRRPYQPADGGRLYNRDIPQIQENRP